MKRLRLLLLLWIPTLLATAGSVYAQPCEKNRLGIRAGMEIAYIRARGEYVHGTTQPRVGFRIGVADQVLLHRAIPLYIETGVHFASRGGRYEGVSFRPMQMQIPLLVTWHFRPGTHLRIRPLAGLVYGVGIGGMARTADGWAELYGERGFLRRSDWSARLGVELVWRRIALQAGFDAGTGNLLRPQAATSLLPAGINELHSRSFSIQIGVDF